MTGHLLFSAGQGRRGCSAMQSVSRRLLGAGAYPLWGRSVWAAGAVYSGGYLARRGEGVPAMVAGTAQTHARQAARRARASGLRDVLTGNARAGAMAGATWGARGMGTCGVTRRTTSTMIRRAKDVGLLRLIAATTSEARKASKTTARTHEGKGGLNLYDLRWCIPRGGLLFLLPYRAEKVLGSISEVI